MTEYSPLLKRQLKRSHIDPDNAENIQQENLNDFLHRIELAYQDLKEKNAQLLRATEKSSEEIRDYIEKLKSAEEINQKRQADILSIMENIEQGIFTIDHKGDINSEYSSYLETVLMTKDIANKDISTVLLNFAELGEDYIEQIKTSLDFMVGEDHINFISNSHIFPSKLKFKKGENPVRHLELEWAPILNTDKSVEKILVTIRDISQILELQERHAEQSREISIIYEIITMDGEKLGGVLRSCENYIKDIEKVLEQDVLGEEDQADIYRALHTIKGNARTFGMKVLTNLVHHAEEFYRHTLGQKTIHTLEQSRNDIAQIKSIIKEYRRVASEKFHILEGSKSAEFLEVSSTLDSILQIAQSFKSQQYTPIQSMDAITEIIESFKYIPLDRVFHDLSEGLPSMAAELQKEPPSILVSSEGFQLHRDFEPKLRDIFVHMVRNSIDHGIEASDVRLKSNKPKQGCIFINTSCDSSKVQISLWDDGAGLNLSAILKKSAPTGRLRSASIGPENALDIAELIFAPGFSTSEKHSTISGAGIGMSAIKSLVREMGGEVCLTAEPEKLYSIEGSIFLTFKLTIILPASYFKKSDPVKPVRVIS